MRALLIPVEGNMRVVEHNGLEDLQKLVGGDIETLPVGREDVAPFFNEEGKVNGLPRNERATKLLAASLMPEDHVAGDMVLCGLNTKTGDTVALPSDVKIGKLKRL